MSVETNLHGFTDQEQAIVQTYERIGGPTGVVAEIAAQFGVTEESVRAVLYRWALTTP